MNLELFISDKVKQAVGTLYGVPSDNISVSVQATRKEFIGDLTVVLFSYLKISKTSPEQTGEAIGQYLMQECKEIESFNVVKGFLNLKFSDLYWNSVLDSICKTKDFGQFEDSGRTIMIEFSSPNTNKPLHLGHIRNNLLGDSVARLLSVNGHKVIKVNLVNDRGIHICKSMLAWQLSANGETPDSSGKKGDHLVGEYYVKFNSMLKEEGVEPEDSKLMSQAREMLVKWEQGDEDTVGLWSTMNSWVYDGFDRTYNRMGISFDKIYYESNTYLLGKSLVQLGLEKGVLYQKEDNSIWCDLTEDGLDHKLLLRPDGTSVYMTQDLGTAVQRFEEYNFKEHIYVVGNEQNYHFQVLVLILKKLGYDWADYIYHLSYGMVELPEGKMKSREGTVVDADDLLDRMYNTAKETSLELGKLAGMEDEQKEDLYNMISLGALKYFILKVDPKKTMLFDPKESIDFNGNTGPFIQYTHARIKSILRKAQELGYEGGLDLNDALHNKELSIIKTLSTFPKKVAEAGEEHSPALIANYTYELAKEFNQFYGELSIMREENESLRSRRIALISVVAQVLSKAMGILGINLPEKM